MSLKSDYFAGEMQKGGEKKCIVPPQAVVGMKATAWMCERREVTLREHDLLVGLQGHLSAAFHCGRTQLSRSRYGEKWGRGACSVNRPPLSPAWMWSPARSFVCCTATAHLERSPSVFYTSIPAVTRTAQIWVFEPSSKARAWEGSVVICSNKAVAMMISSVSKIGIFRDLT